ncbi:GAF domain-containing protein [Calothrix sp. UHCC 0171]|uniref:sensor histidine kinase n=1 Tax=Calothrix sp. UHCC 0171 TaxID=3110245 RepID=UPI002B1EF721|nr:GAF domain-containing protein [Calothrix sp. UHCC 0171]MEA5570262.1 GAF domain-containing protein [Calothrix sp. UHCC 0171]
MVQPQRPIAAEQHIISLGRVLQSLREEDNVDVLIETIISFVKEQFDYNLVWVALYDRLNHILIGKGGLLPENSNNPHFLTQRLVLSPGDLLEQVVIEQRPLGVADLRAEKRAEGWQEFAKRHNLQGTIILPIRYKDKCLGLLMLASSRWGYLLPTDAKARLMMVLGELAAALHQYEMNWQQKQNKRLEVPLLELLQNLQTLSNLEQRLEAVLRTTHDFVAPSYTHIYWFEREGRYFWRRATNQYNQNNGLPGRKDKSSPTSITVEELSDFYYALAVNEMVSIGEGRTSLKSHFTVQLMRRLHVRSLLAAPIIWQRNLLGFIAVEASEARIWKETDKNFVQGAAGLISLTSPVADMEATIKSIRDEAELTSQVARGIYSEHDFEEIFSNCAGKILAYLGATRFILIVYNPDQNRYEILHQAQAHKYRPLKFHFDELRQVDWQLLQRSEEAIGVENAEDLRFFNWRSPLLEVGVRSFMIANCVAGKSPESLLLITHENNRAWTVQEKELVQLVSQQFGVITRQWQLHHRNKQQEKIMQNLQDCLRIIEQAEAADSEPGDNHLEMISLRQIASVLNCPLGFMLSWIPGEKYAEIIPGVVADNFTIKNDALIPVKAEALIQLALTTPDTHQKMLLVKANDLPEDTRKWMYGKGIGQLLLMALRATPEHEATGVIVMADTLQRRWSEQSLKAAEALICQLSWSRRQKLVTQRLLAEQKKLQQLNWYKHRRYEENQRHLASLITQIKNLGIPTTEFSQVRYQQILRQVENTNLGIAGLLRDEQWTLDIANDRIVIPSLLKRSLEQVDNLLKQHKLWVGIHGLGQNVTDDANSRGDTNTQSSQYSLIIIGDIAKIEIVLNELLVSACERSVSGGRIDFWCRRLDERSLELSITDNGTINPQLLAELYQDSPKDIFRLSHLNKPPGLHLLICQNLMQQMGGELHFYQLPDSRIVSRLLVPLAAK